MKRVWIVGILLCLLVSVADCGGSPESLKSPTQSVSPSPTPPPDVILSYDASFDGTAMIITGKASIPDGALLAYEVTSEPFVINALADGVVEVKDGRWSATVDLSNFPRGQIEIWVAFQTALGTKVKQPAEIIALYGELGERITGPQTTTLGALKVAELVKIVEY